MKDGNRALMNGASYRSSVTASRFSSLLASGDRDYLLSPTGAQIKVSNLDGKVLGLYFSANWYPPCRNFNQILVRTYEELKGRNVSNFEVVYVSSDEDTDAFNEYRASMPWPAIPFSDLETKIALNRKFEIEGIPCLIILQPSENKDETTTLYEGVEIVYRYGVDAFPFTEERLEELKKEDIEKELNQNLFTLLINHNRDYLLAHSIPKQVNVASLEGKTIGLYFSAKWCLPGVFTPKLISVYHKIKQMVGTKEDDDEDFEIVFVSSDRDEDSYDSYFGSMPWLALPFGDPTIKKLAKHFDVQGIPWLIILGPNGKTVTKQGRNLINLYRENAYPFTEARVAELVKEMEEEAKNLPTSVRYVGHRHELSLVSEGNGGGPFICCACDEQGCGWAYQCLECGFEVHPKCIESSNRDEAAIDGR